MAHGVTETQYIQKATWKSWIIWLCGALFYFYQFVLRVSPGVMTDELMDAFMVQGCALGILSAFYYNAYATMQIPLGIMMDRFGPRRLIAAACFTAAMGAYLFSIAESIPMAAFGRLLTGAGAACAFIGTMKLATIWFPLNRIGVVVGLTMFLGTTGALFGQAPFAYLIDGYGWRGVLFIMALIGFSLAATIYIFVRNKTGYEPESTEQNKATNKEHGILDGLLTVVSSPQAWLIALFGSLMHVPVAAIADLWGTPFFKVVYGISNKEASYFAFSLFAGIAVGAPFATGISDYIKSRKILMLSGAILSLIVYMIIIYVGNIPVFAMYGLMFLAGIAFTGQCLVFACLCEIMPLSASGVAVGFTNMTVMLSGVIFEPFVGWLLDWHSGPQKLSETVFTIGDFQFAFLPVPLSLFLALLLLKFIKETHPELRKSD